MLPRGGELERRSAPWSTPCAAPAGDRDGDLTWVGVLIVLFFAGSTLAFIVWLASRLLG